MIFRFGGAAALMAAATLAAAPAQAAKVCAWMTEEIGEDDFHQVAVWMQSDQDLDFYYAMAGEGLTGDGMKAHSPSKGTYSLSAGEAEKVWGFGSTLTPPGVIDVIAEVRQTPADVFAEEAPPLLAAFTFHRDVPEGEIEPPKTLAAHQCAEVKPGR